MTPRLLPLLLAILLTAPIGRVAADGPEGTRILGEPALRAALSDRTFYGRYEGGINWIEYYTPDGRSAYWDGCTHDGAWWIKNDFVCFRYRGDASDRDYCWMLFQVGSQYEFLMAADQEFGCGAGLHHRHTPGQSRAPAARHRRLRVGRSALSRRPAAVIADRQRPASVYSRSIS